MASRPGEDRSRNENENVEGNTSGCSSAGGGKTGTTTATTTTTKSSSPKPSPSSSNNAQIHRGRSRTRGSGSNRDEHNGLRRGYHALHSSFGKVFNVEKRWKIIREMGSGAYGFVVSAADEITGEVVAIKLVTRVTERIQLSKRALREITLLRHFANHENITGLIDVDASSSDLEEIYIFMEPMEADLHQIIKSGQALTTEHVQYFVYQILRGMKYIHSASVVHRDLKPGNLLVNADCELKICDFGLSRGFDASPDNEVAMTEYVATRWYRAPEIMLAFRKYGTAIDVWSIGCIFAELLLGKPFFKGKDYVDQLNKIIDILGTPSEETITRVGSQKAQVYIRSLPKRKPVPFEKLFPDTDAQAIELLRRMVAFDPAERISVAEALKHPWLSTYHNPEDEPDCATGFERWKEVEELESHEDFKRALWDEIQDYRREVRGLKSASGSPVMVKRPTPMAPHSIVDPQAQPSATMTGLGQIQEESPADLKTGSTGSSNSASPHRKEPTTTETSPPPAEVDPSQAEPESQPALPPPEPLPPLPPQDDQRSRPISRANSGRSERRASHDNSERASSTASITTPTDPMLTYARRSSFLQPQQPSMPNSGRSSPVHPYHPNLHASRKPIPNFAEGGYHDEAMNLKEQYGHAKHLHRNTVAFPSGEGYVVPARSRSGSMFGPHPGVPFPSSTLGGDGISGLPGTGNYNYTVGPGTVGRLLRTLSTVSIHESGQGLKGGLADIAPIGKFITERGSDDESSASEVPEEFKEGGLKDGDRGEGKDMVRKGRKRKSAGMFNL